MKQGEEKRNEANNLLFLCSLMSEDGLRTGSDHEGFEDHPLSRWKDEVCSGGVIGK